MKELIEWLQELQDNGHSIIEIKTIIKALKNHKG